MPYRDVIAHPERYHFVIDALGQPRHDSPIRGRQFVEDAEQVAFTTEVSDLEQIFTTAGASFPAFQKAGPRRRIFHNPLWSRAAIVTCGGLCPGINDVIKALVRVLYFDYGVENVYGIRYGYRGLSRQHQLAMRLEPAMVDTLHERGGTLLGSSRGKQDVAEMVDTLADMNINLLFCVGGDGTLKGASAIAREVKVRGLAIGVVGVPKTIDNDLSFIDRSFGFETAVYAASGIVTTASNEANGALNGVGLVKLMGRDSGFIAAYASLASSVASFCLIPEAPFELEGARGLFKALERRFRSGRSSAVIVVAEGAGQHLFEAADERRDASGNVLKQDIGELLKTRITRHFEQLGQEITVKYFDPSYYIRSVPAHGADAIYCYLLAENAVHAAMAGKTNLVIGHWHNSFTHVPIHLATLERRKIDTEGALWNAILGMTRQNEYFHRKD